MTALDVRNLSIRRGGRPVVQDLSFRADCGELVALTGPSGAGKTSVLRAIAGLDPLAAGEIHVDTVVLRPGPLHAASRMRELHRTVGMVFQFHHLFAHMSALHNVMLAPVHVLQDSRADSERKARDLLDMLGVGARADAMPHELSGGEAQRVAIARALAMAPAMVLMDEPTASLDTARRVDLAATLRRLVDQGRTIVVATHDAEFVDACAGRIVTLAPRGVAPSSADA
jgi:ABC-type polar amino acid transport system ATPase subunit